MIPENKVAVKRQGIPGLSCWSCGVEDQLVIDINDAVVFCVSCDARWSAEQIRQQMYGLNRLAAWVEACPPE